MYHSKHTKPSRRRGSRKVLLVAALCLLLTLVIGGTVAYLLDVTDPVENVFMPSDVTCYVYEVFDGTTKSEVRIQNTGNIDAFIRVVVSANYVDAAGNICAAHDVPDLPAPGSGWKQGTNSIYYYSNEVSPGGYTAPLFGGAVTLGTAEDGCAVKMEIAASAIQAAGGAKADAQKNYGW